MKSGKYWKSRFEILEAAQNKAAHETLADVEKMFNSAQKEIDGQISAWYQRFASNNQISLSEAQRALTTKELAEFKWTVSDYIKYGEQNGLNQQWMRQLENASARFHITRLEALKLETQHTIEKLFGNQLDSIDSLMKRQYLDSYYHTIFEVQKGFNVGWDVAGINDKRLQRIISKPWTIDNKTFSSRIWDDKSRLLNNVHTELTRNMILGKAPDTSIKNLAKAMNTSKSNAGRLIMTESAAFSAMAQKDAFDDLDVEKFEVIETLDSQTCEICGAMDGKVFPMSEYEIGVTVPPLHPWCRGCTVPAFDDNFSVGQRAARDPETGKTCYVPSDMKYTDWKEKYVDKNNLTVAKNDDKINVGLFPVQLGGVKRGTPMTFENADGKRPNPNFSKGGGYTINCQSCVVSYESRLRGFDVQTLPNTKGSKLAELSRATNKAWIDPTTGKHPAYIFDEAVTTPKKLTEYLEKTVEADKRYTLQWTWKGRGSNGHIVSVDRDINGALRLYDPQTGSIIQGDKITAYAERFKYKTRLGGLTVNKPPKLLRVDNLHYNLDMVNNILEGVIDNA